MNEYFLLGIILTTITSGWVIGTKAVCQRNYDYVEFYALFPILSIVSSIVALVIYWINNGFQSFMIATVVLIITGKINGILITPVLIKIFGYGRIGAILPIISCIISFVFLFSNI